MSKKPESKLYYYLKMSRILLVPLRKQTPKKEERTKSLQLQARLLIKIKLKGKMNRN
jgi:hypothetical protein